MNSEEGADSVSFQKAQRRARTPWNQGKIGIVGGAAMVLAFNVRESTKDVDAIFVPSSKVRELASKVAAELRLPDDWLNDAVKGFMPKQPNEQRILFRTDAISVWVPEPQYLLAMKAVAARFDTADASDLKFLIKHLKLTSPAKVFEVIQAYYPRSAIPAKTQFFVEELFE